MVELLVAIGQLLALLMVTAAFALVALQVVRPGALVSRAVFLIGTLGVPVGVLGAAVAGWLPMLWTVFISGIAVLAGTIGFPFIGLRRAGLDASKDRRRLRTDTVLYLGSSVLWFATLYWSGSAIEGFHFSVDSAAIGALPPPCVSDPRFFCNRLTLVEALQFSAGNLLTLGAAGISPLDDVTRLFSLLQLLPTFTSVYIIART
jgi:hypothetical protein